MLNYLRRLMDERTTLTETMAHMGEQAATEERDFNEAEETALAGIQTRCTEIDTQLRTHHSQVESMRAFAELQTKLESTREQNTSTAVESRRPMAHGTHVVGSGVHRVRTVPLVQRARPVRPLRDRGLPRHAGGDHHGDAGHPALRDRRRSRRRSVRSSSRWSAR